jgi:hypothetical protein
MISSVSKTMPKNEIQTNSRQRPVRVRATGADTRNSLHQYSRTGASGSVLRNVRPTNLSRQGQAVRIASRNPWTMGYLTVVAVVIAFLVGLGI